MSGAPSTVREPTEPANIAASKPRSVAIRPAIGHGQVMQVHKALAVLFGKYGSTLLRTCMVNGLPGFVTREADGELQTTALDIEDGHVTAIYIMRNPDKLRHLH